jgi:multiple sugar transport system permease protein
MVTANEDDGERKARVTADGADDRATRQPARRRWTQAGRRRPLWQRAILHAVLLVLSAIFLVPLFWLIGSSLKTDDQIRAFPPEWLPDLPFYSAESPYVDTREAQEALEEATDRDSRAMAFGSAYRVLAVGDVTFQGEADGASVSVARQPEWAGATGMIAVSSTEQIDGQAGAVIAYVEPEYSTGLHRIGLALMVYREESERGPLRERQWAHGSGSARKGACGSIGADLRWTPQLARFTNLTLRLHGDRSWREVRVRLATPDGAYWTPKPILLSFANWTDVILIRQADGSIPWGAHRLVEDPGEQPTASGKATLELEVLSADRWQVVLRKLFHNYPSGLTFIPFGRYLFNTLLICALVVVGVLISCSLVAYGLARIHWRGRNGLFYAIIATMMLPFQVTMVPLFVVFARLGWVDTFLPLFVPAFFGNAFFVFLLRQFFLTVPPELTDAARVDGCSEFGIYWRVVLPLAKPALATVGLFAFMNTWNDYVGPLIYLSDASKYTLSLGLATFSSQYGSYPGMLMAVTAVMTLPIIALFFIAQRTFIQGITLTGIKG